MIWQQIAEKPFISYNFAEYGSEKKLPEQNWRTCHYFSKMTGGGKK